MKSVAVIQSSYIPWKGYFDIVRSVDEFILYDDAQYTKRDWRNRNRIKTKGGVKWLTIPVHTKGRRFQSIKDTVISDRQWNRKHWRTISQCYSRAKYFRDFKEVFESLYLSDESKYLSEVNYKFMAAICDLLDIRTKLSWSMDYSSRGRGTEVLVGLCQQVGAKEYVSGPRAKDYIDESLFSDADIQVRYVDYTGYPTYEQLFPPFDHFVSILDLIFNVGLDVTGYMKKL